MTLFPIFKPVQFVFDKNHGPIWIPIMPKMLQKYFAKAEPRCGSLVIVLPPPTGISTMYRFGPCSGGLFAKLTSCFRVSSWGGVTSSGRVRRRPLSLSLFKRSISMDCTLRGDCGCKKGSARNNERTWSWAAFLAGV